MLSSPTLPADSLESVWGRIVEGIKSIDDDWMGALMKRVRKDFFAGSSYAGLPSGTVDGVTACSKEDLLKRLGEICRPEGMVISIVGDILQTDADKIAAEITKRIASRGKVVTTKPTIVYSNKAYDETFPGTQSVLAWAYPTFPITGKDRYAMEVLDTYMSGYGLPSGPLHDRLRNEGLVYVTHAYDWNRPTGGMFFIYAATAPGMEERTKQIVTELLAEMKSKPITEEQLKTAEDMCVTGRNLYEMQRPIDLAQTMAYCQIFGLGYDEFASHDENIRKVTVAEVQQAAEKYFGQGFTLYMHGEEKSGQPK
jgi:zinc protease